jgi:hypothetical protein
MARRPDEIRHLLELHSASSSFLSAFRGPSHVDVRKPYVLETRHLTGNSHEQSTS